MGAALWETGYSGDSGELGGNLSKRNGFKNSFRDSVTRVEPGSQARVFGGVFEKPRKG